jgi:hypothetical protein
LPHLIRWFEQQGIDATSLRRLFGMADLSDPDLGVSEASVEAAWSLAVTLTHDDAIGVHLATWIPRGALDVIEYAFRSSPSLRTGFERLARYGRVMSDRVAARRSILDRGVNRFVPKKSRGFKSNSDASSSLHSKVSGR